MDTFRYLADKLKTRVSEKKKNLCEYFFILTLGSTGKSETPSQVSLWHYVFFKVLHQHAFSSEEVLLSESFTYYCQSCFHKLPSFTLFKQTYFLSILPSVCTSAQIKAMLVFGFFGGFFLPWQTCTKARAPSDPQRQSPARHCFSISFWNRRLSPNLLWCPSLREHSQRPLLTNHNKLSHAVPAEKRFTPGEHRAAAREMTHCSNLHPLSKLN